MKTSRVSLRIGTNKLRIFIKVVLLLSFPLALTFIFMFLKTKSSLINENFIAYTSAFNFLYILTIFPLEGKLSRKLIALVIGDILSFIWNGLYPYLLSLPRNSIFNPLFFLINPIINALWIVSMWSLGLSLITPLKTEETSI